MATSSKSTEPLQKARKDAGLSQSKLANLLGISQAQVSKYESNPGRIPLDLTKKWEKILGVDMDILLETTDEPSGLDPEDPFSNLRRRLNLLKQYANSSSISTDELPDEIPTPEKLLSKIEELRRKPNLVLSGKFDSGKTHLTNYLLGGRYLPTKYQPATRVITVVRHMDDKPEWQQEDVWLLDENFWPTDRRGDVNLDFSLLDEKDHCENHRLRAGTLDSLKKYGTHDEEGDTLPAHAAVVYIDSPFLAACNVVDLPGYSDQGDRVSDDVEKAQSALQVADIMLYTSQAVGHVSGEDFMRMSQLFRTLPAPEKEYEEFPTLGNLFIVTTHASSNVSDDDLKDLQERAASRLYEQMEDTALKDRSELSGRDIRLSDLENRFVSFWEERPDRCEDLEETLSELLTEDMPAYKIREVERAVQSLKESTKGKLSRRIEEYESTINDIEKRREELRYLEKKESDRKRKLQERKEQFRRKVENQRERSLEVFETAANDLLTERRINTLIEEHYSSKDEAQEYAPALLADRLQQRMEEIVSEYAEPLKEDVDNYLDLYDEVLREMPSQGTESVQIDFDAKGAFIGGLAGLGTVGALGAWAASLGNLGGYVLVAKGVSVLSALGIGVGTSSVMGAVAAIGGPITLGLGLGAVIALGAWRLFGESWETRLARKLVKHFNDENVVDQYRKGINEFWDETWEAFLAGAHAAEERYQKRKERLEELTSEESPQKERIEELLGKLEALRDFFAGIPWAPVAEDEQPVSA